MVIGRNWVVTGSGIWLHPRFDRHPTSRFCSPLTLILDWLCQHWGFCLPQYDRIKICSIDHWDAREFAVAVLRAEGFASPEAEKKWIRQLSAKFIEHFGAGAVSEDPGTQIADYP
jgi:hypothetical protein